ncbi:dual specificity protein phosphatase 19-like [Eriocheir sinensis]|uniref:dual specificity protein phosphatase 19-like n=1 Tax=Eriocheir sinensis TaxID=95602 RepID=UPI0021C89576|nr:dual specificity protein phosphatase 19-like [Eriocheir sinensis]
MSSFAQQLSAKRGSLRHTQTQVTTPDGQARLEELFSDGTHSVTSMPSTSPGFVVDTKPDLRYTFILNKVILGSQDVAHDLDILTNNKVTHILNVATGVINLFEGWFTYKTKEAFDTPTFRILDILEECCDYIQAAVVSGGCVLVHCNAGVSRSASVVMAYLMRNYGMSFDEAFRFVKSKRSFVRPNEGFMKQLKEYEQLLAMT